MKQMNGVVTMNDLISRQMAIDKFESWLKVDGYSEGELNIIKAVLYELRSMPSAHSETCEEVMMRVMLQSGLQH